MSLYTQNGNKNTRMASRNSMESFRTSLFVFCLCGVFGVLPDIDHVIQIGDIPRETSSRFIHFPVLVITCTFVLYFMSYVGRLYWSRFLRRKIN
jgi:hypothetical protein